MGEPSDNAELAMQALKVAAKPGGGKSMQQRQLAVQIGMASAVLELAHQVGRVADWMRPFDRPDDE
jgi:adenine C2-methylase RlmN of 23S rRNA A2503 and tRNA A37